MKTLGVPYIKQMDVNHCGAAALEMVYRYYGISKVDQDAIFHKYKELEPNGTGEHRISTENLVNDAREKGFNSGWFRIAWNNISKASEEIQSYLEQGIPLIACQRYTQPGIGHFRVIIGLNKKRVCFHDPCPKTGASFQKWRKEEFMEAWQPDGKGNVTGGVAVFIKR